MSERQPVIVLDPAKVRAARLARGYPERVLSGILGVSNRVIDRLEEGCDQAHLDLRFVHELATALGRDVADLLPDTPPGPDQESRPDDRVEAGDVEKVGALLASDGGQVHIDIAAQALGWSRARTLVALHNLEGRLRPTGQRLAWLDELSVSLAAAPIDGAVPAAVTRRDITIFGLNLEQTRMLHQLIVTGTPARIGDWDARHRQGLVNAGFLDLDMSSPTSSVLPMTLSAEATFSLVLDD